ncbi:protein of unknown function [Streptomyces sp. KY75]|nr:protein of unknown function [Streptomyces sp. KY75]CAD5985775.1 protein of unknown function [Streptomyces sp. KY70]
MRCNSLAQHAADMPCLRGIKCVIAGSVRLFHLRIGGNTRYLIVVLRVAIDGSKVP